MTMPQTPAAIRSKRKVTGLIFRPEAKSLYSSDFLSRLDKVRAESTVYKADNLPVLICFGYHSKSTKVVDKNPTTGINIVIDPPGKF
jgi:hypothetical protein